MQTHIHTHTNTHTHMLPSVHNLCIQTHAHTRTHTHAYKHTHACIQTNTHRLPSVPPLPLGATALSQRFDPTATEVVPSFRRTSTVLTAAQQQVGVHVLPNNRWVYNTVPSFRWTSIFTAAQQQVGVQHSPLLPMDLHRSHSRPTTGGGTRVAQQQVGIQHSPLLPMDLHHFHSHSTTGKGGLHERPIGCHV